RHSIFFSLLRIPYWKLPDSAGIRIADLDVRSIRRSDMITLVILAWIQSSAFQFRFSLRHFETFDSKTEVADAARILWVPSGSEYKDGIAEGQHGNRVGFLFRLQTEQILVPLRGFLQIGDGDRDVVDATGGERRRRRRGNPRAGRSGHQCERLNE